LISGDTVHQCVIRISRRETFAEQEQTSGRSVNANAVLRGTRRPLSGEWYIASRAKGERLIGQTGRIGVAQAELTGVEHPDGIAAASCPVTNDRIVPRIAVLDSNVRVAAGVSITQQERQIAIDTDRVGCNWYGGVGWGIAWCKGVG